MKKIFTVLVSLIVLTFCGCAKNFTINENVEKVDTNLTNDEKTAKADIEKRGYNIIEYKGQIDKYKLDKSKIFGGTETTPYQQVWGVQSISPDDYFGKEIITYEFIVNNHPLQKVDSHAKNGVRLYYMFSDGKIIGGFSYPNEDVYGAVSSLEGKSLEEVTGLTFSKWSEEWTNKYSQ